MPSIISDEKLQEEWAKDEEFQKFCIEEPARLRKQKDGKKKAEGFEALPLAKKMQAYCDSLKKSLPFVIFVATYEETPSTKGQKMGAWRKQAACKLNGLCVIDFDHVQGDVRKVWAEAYSKLSDEDKARILFVYVTPSGHGLKVVFMADASIGNLIDNQIVFSLKLGLDPDEACKDASRGAFLTTNEDVIYLDERIIDYENPEFGAKYNELYHEGKSQATISLAADNHGLARTKSLAADNHGLVRTKSLAADNHGLARTKSLAADNHGLARTKEICESPCESAATENRESPCESAATENRESPCESAATENRESPCESAAYNDVPYSKIIEAWLDGVNLDKNRHNTLTELASHLRYLIGKNPKKITQVVMQLPWVQDLAAEGEDVAGTVSSVMGWRYNERMPVKLREALQQAGALEKSTQKEPSLLCTSSPGESDIYDALPLEKWAEELQEMARHYPCMKELFVNVHPYKLPAVWFSSAALFGTLMTRAWYHFWYEPELVRRLNYSIFIIGDPGAGKNVIEKFYKKIADPMIQADGCLIDAVNRYKEGRTERTTSTKAQKGEALKRPVVGIRVHPARTATGEFIRHMNAAIETVEGKPLNLHMFSFDAELDNVTKQNKGGDWKDREILELKAFHNEEDGQMYANQESVTGMFNVYWNFIYTGTPYALHRKVNQRNFGTGMSTRLAVIPLPDKGLAKRHQEVDPDANETLKIWAYRLDRVAGEIPVEALNDETFDWQSSHMEIAEFNHDKADRTLLKRIPYYGIGISLPFILMRHWDEWQEQRTLTMDDTDKRLCRLAMEIQYRCQQFFFGEMAYNYFADQNKEFVVRKRSNRYNECFRKLPDEFKTKQFMDCFGVTQSAASRAIIRFRNDGIIETVKYGVYKKKVSDLP